MSVFLRTVINKWPSINLLLQKKVGTWCQAGAEASGYEAVALAALTRHKQWTQEEVIALASQARADARKRDIHTMFDL